MKVSAMSWLHYMKAIILRILAVPRRNMVRRRTESAFHKLDDRLLADIGMPRHRIADYAHRVALQAVPVSDLHTLKAEDNQVAITVERNDKFRRMHRRADINRQYSKRPLRASSGI